MESTIVVTCSNRHFLGGKASCSSGLQCRINGRTSVSAFWDAENQALCCRVQREVGSVDLKAMLLCCCSQCPPSTLLQEVCTPSFSYDVVDASGNVLCRSTDCM